MAAIFARGGENRRKKDDRIPVRLSEDDPFFDEWMEDLPTLIRLGNPGTRSHSKKLRQFEPQPQYVSGRD